MKILRKYKFFLLMCYELLDNWIFILWKIILNKIWRIEILKFILFMFRQNIENFGFKIII